MTSAGSHDARVARALADLRPETAFVGRIGAPQPIADRLKALKTPGAAIAVIEDGAIVWSGGFGRRHVERDDPITATTLFQAGSVSKPVFALAVMRLVQEGKLDLDADVNDILTTWKVPPNDGWQPRVTLRQLLSHTAGLTVHGFPGYRRDDPVPAIRQVLDGAPPANTAGVLVNLLPGTQFRYSGGGTTVAQQALVDRFARPFPELMDDLVLRPLGLTGSTYAQPLPAALWDVAATGHPWWVRPVPGDWHVYPEAAAAGLWTCADDLGRLGATLLRVLAGRELLPWLSRETLGAMLRPQLPHQVDGQGPYVGLGWFCDGKGESFRFGHAGWDEGFLAQVRLYPKRGCGAVVLINSNHGDVIRGEILAALGREYDWPKDLEDDSAPPTDLAVFTGRYVGEGGSELTIGEDGGALVLRFGRQLPLSLIAKGELSFAASVVNARIVFERDDSGAVARLALIQDGQRLTAKKSS